MPINPFKIKDIYPYLHDTFLVKIKEILNIPEN
jgi:hypothetical protein